MKTFIFLLICVIIEINCQESSVFIIGSKYIRPKQPFIVALANPINANVKLNLTLQCDDESNFSKSAIVQLNRQSMKRHRFEVPDIANSDCLFSAVNDGGRIMVNHAVQLLYPKIFFSFFIITDKPIYKPGDEIRIQVVVVDMALRPAKDLKHISVSLTDCNGQSKRQWRNAKLENGIFRKSYWLTAMPALGMWNITVKDYGNLDVVKHEKTLEIEVREYVLPKFVIKVAPSRTLLISEQSISLDVASHYTFGGPVRGRIRVELYANQQFPNKASDIKENQFDSSSSFTFGLKDELLPEEDQDYALVKAVISLTETFSNMKAVVIKQIPVFKHPYKIKLVKPAMYYRPGAKYFCKVSVKDHSGIPLEPWGQSIKLKTDTSEQYEEAQLNKQGIAYFTLQMPDELSTVSISAEFDDVEYDNLGSVEGVEDVTIQYLQVNTKDRIITGKSVNFNVNSNERFNELYYFVVSRGSIVYAGHNKFSKRSSFTIKFKLSADMAPHAKLLVYTMPHGQLIMDFIEMDFESFENEFEFILDEQNGEYRPNQDLHIDIKAASDSYIAFQAIDQGALLLGHDKFGLTRDEVLDELEKYVSEDSNDLDIIHSYGLFSRIGEETNKVGSRRKRRSIPRAASKSIVIRTSFPEAWLWKNYTMEKKPERTISAVVPGTFTSWYVTGFALSPSRGLGLLSAPKRLTVGDRFYIVANLPYSIKRGEVSLVQVTIFNFMGNSLTTDVTLFNKNDEIDFVDNPDKKEKWRKKAIFVPTHQPKSISFLIKAKKLGNIAIKIEAVNELTSDALEHMLRVTPESRLYTTTVANFINLPSHGFQTFDVNIGISRNADPGSTKIEVFVDPYFLASTALNLNSMFKIPSGGANLNLLTFIPNVVVLDYLTETETEAKEIMQKARDYLSSGYQNQLSYKYADGGFGQWKPQKGKSSLFLTALIGSSFITASKHITIKNEEIIRTFSWISGKQKPDGCFKEEEGTEIVYAPMQDGSSSVALTAFIVAAVKENKNIASQFTVLLEKGEKCVADNFYKLTKIHDIALATYALSLTNHTNRENFLNTLVTDSIRDDTGRHWDGEMSVEIAGYALLSYLAQDRMIDAIPIMEWLNKQRYSSGEFEGVHSSFVALKALGKMASYLTGRSNEYRVHIKYGDHIETFDVPNSHSLSSISHELPDNVRKCNLSFTGIGFGFVQLTYQYNMNIQLAAQSFNLDVNVLNPGDYNVLNLKICMSYIQKESHTTSGVTLVEVHVPSGLVFNENAVKESTSRIRNIERVFDNTAIFVYYNALDTSQVCFEATAHRKYKIALHRPSYVVVYDTNNMASFAIKTYEGTVAQLCEICDVEDCKSMRC
ncbi:thioester-containing protein 1 allele R1-like [Armigeres subalbatus]|uniref:thioester-containing protein 1 allele R1-like n=1 Tax=Armigeres subalbatus TaxID=124917 RepID=UPI002ED53DB3